MGAPVVLPAAPHPDGLWRPRAGLWGALLAWGLAGTLAAGSAGAEGSEAAAPQVGLGQLLKLPDSYRVDPQARHRGTEEEWRARFSNADAEVAKAESDLKRLQARLGRMAGETSAYQMSAPGMGSGSGAGKKENAPMSFGLSERIRKQKERVVEAGRERRDLVVEADLADIPDAWRESREDVKTAGEPGR